MLGHCSNNGIAPRIKSAGVMPLLIVHCKFIEVEEISRDIWDS